MRRSRFSEEQIFADVADSESTSPLSARCSYQHLVAMLGDIDGYENLRFCRRLGQGHGRSPLQSWSANQL